MQNMSKRTYEYKFFILLCVPSITTYQVFFLIFPYKIIKILKLRERERERERANTMAWIKLGFHLRGQRIP